MIALGRLGLGTAPIGGLYESVEDATAHAVVERAWFLGVRYFDTAPLYGAGLAERRLGAALRGKPRHGFAISTKVGRLLRPGRSEWHGAPDARRLFRFSYEAALRSLEESLERLGLDRVDVAYVHDPDDHFAEALAGSFRALQRLRGEGVVRAIGVGANQPEVLCRFAREADPDCFLIAGRYTVLDRRAADELLPLCEEQGIAVIAGGVFNSGVLAGGNTFDYEPRRPKSSRGSDGSGRRAHATACHCPRPRCSSRFGTPPSPPCSSAAARQTRSPRTCGSPTSRCRTHCGSSWRDRRLAPALLGPGARRLSLDDGRGRPAATAVRSRRSGAAASRTRGQRHRRRTGAPLARRDTGVARDRCSDALRPRRHRLGRSHRRRRTTAGRARRRARRRKAPGARRARIRLASSRRSAARASGGRRSRARLRPARADARAARRGRDGKAPPGTPLRARPCRQAPAPGRDAWAEASLRSPSSRTSDCKLSGLFTEGDPEETVAQALRWFGADRCMFGSDWPVCLLARNMATRSNSSATMQTFSPEQRSGRTGSASPEPAQAALTRILEGSVLVQARAVPALPADAAPSHLQGFLWAGQGSNLRPWD